MTNGKYKLCKNCLSPLTDKIFFGLYCSPECYRQYLTKLKDVTKE